MLTLQEQRAARNPEIVPGDFRPGEHKHGREAPHYLLEQNPAA